MPEINPVEQLIREATGLYGIGHEIADKVGLAQAIWAQAEYAKVANDEAFEYVDNSRWARVGNEAEEAHYKSISAGGCCGYQDWEVIDKHGQTWRFGFNHGH